jgi:hypothetical protein
MFIDIISESLGIDCGVPQSSILGPLLFLIFISDMPYSTKLSTNIFADDTTYQGSNSNIPDLFKEINQELCKAAKWFNDNHLTIRPSKTKYILFGKPPASPTEKLTITLNGHTLEIIQKTVTTKFYKFLGLHIDENLNWKHHISQVNLKIQRISFHLMQIRKLVSKQHKILIYNGLIKPHIEYGISIWGNGKSINKLTKKNKKIIRITCGVNKYALVEPLLKEHNILQINDLYQHKIITQLQCIRHNQGPDILRAFFSWTEDHSRRPFQLKYPPTISNLTQELPLNIHPKIWNEFIIDFKLDLSIINLPRK